MPLFAPCKSNLPHSFGRLLLYGFHHFSKRKLRRRKFVGQTRPSLLKLLLGPQFELIYFTSINHPKSLSPQSSFISLVSCGGLYGSVTHIFITKMSESLDIMSFLDQACACILLWVQWTKGMLGCTKGIAWLPYLFLSCPYQKHSHLFFIIKAHYHCHDGNPPYWLVPGHKDSKFVWQ